MRIVVDIPDKYVDDIKEPPVVPLSVLCAYEINLAVRRAARNGNILPKGHGRLIDADKLKEDLGTITEWNGDVHRYVSEKGIDYAPTVLEADKGGDE